MKIIEFIKELLKQNSDISSKRFLAVFCLTPVLITAIFLNLNIEYIYVVSGMIITLLGAGTIEKFGKNFKNNDKNLR